MPPKRAIKSEYDRKVKERIRLAIYLEDCGDEMIPCSHCDKEGRKCLVDFDKSDRCAECVRKRRTCDASETLTSGWESIAKQRRKLDEEEEVAIMKILRLKK